MVAESPVLEFQRPGEKGSTEIKDAPSKLEKTIPAKPTPSKIHKNNDGGDEDLSFPEAPFPDMFSHSHHHDPMSSMMRDMQRDMQRMVR